MFGSLLICFLFGCTLALDSQQRQTILDQHNRVRRGIGASGMLELTYDDKLEAVAQAYLQKLNGQFQHNANRQQDYARQGGSGPVGENWYSGDVQGATDGWVDYKWNGCSEREAFEGKCQGETGHYTQVVWAATARVGCGYTKRMGTLCNYAPAGNFVGQKPYVKGQPCSACPSGTKCSNGLCSGGGSGSSGSGASGSPPSNNMNTPNNNHNSENNFNTYPNNNVYNDPNQYDGYNTNDWQNYPDQQDYSQGQGNSQDWNTNQEWENWGNQPGYQDWGNQGWEQDGNNWQESTNYNQNQNPYQQQQQQQQQQQYSQHYSYSWSSSRGSENEN